VLACFRKLSRLPDLRPIPPRAGGLRSCRIRPVGKLEFESEKPDLARRLPAALPVLSDFRSLRSPCRAGVTISRDGGHEALRPSRLLRLSVLRVVPLVMALVGFTVGICAARDHVDGLDEGKPNWKASFDPAAAALRRQARTSDFRHEGRG